MVPHRSTASGEASWNAGVFQGSTTAQSTTMYYVVPPGKRLGWHSNSSEEVQLVFRGSGELTLEDGARHPIGNGDLLVLKEGESHDIRNTGEGDLCVVAFFPEPRIDHRWRDDTWAPDDRSLTTTRNS